MGRLVNSRHILALLVAVCSMVIFSMGSFALAADQSFEGESALYGVGRQNLSNNDYLSKLETFHPIKDSRNAYDIAIGRRGRMILLWGLASTVGTSILDDETQRHWSHRRRLGDLDYLGNEILGTGVPGLLIGGACWISGKIGKDLYVLHSGYAQVEAIAVTGIVTFLLKGVVNRRRPDESNMHSFPSGHTSTMFATATALQEFFGWKIGVPAYLLGALTAAGRLSDNRHWLSDTVAGAFLGSWIAWSFSSAHLNQLEQKPVQDVNKVDYSISPLFYRENGITEMGVSLLASF